MALNDFSGTVIRPNQAKGAGDPLALAIEEYTGVVEGTIERQSVVAPWIPRKSVKGTSTITNYAVGEATMEVLSPGVTPAGKKVNFNRAMVTVDTVVMARSVLPMLDVFQTVYDARAEIGKEHGKKIAKFDDQAFFIAAIKAGLSTSSPYGTSAEMPGHFGGNRVKFAAANDNLDPVKLYAKILELCQKFQEKDIDPHAEDMALFLRPGEFYVLAQNDLLINSEYVTAAGNSVQNGLRIKTLGIPVVMTNNLPTVGVANTGGEFAVASHHFLSNAGNSNFYDLTADQTKAWGVMLSPRALLAGETIPLQTKVWFDDLTKIHMIDAWESFGVGINRPEFSGLLLDSTSTAAAS